MLARVSQVAKRFPVIFGGCTLGTRYVLGDAFTQTVIEQTEIKDISLKRTLSLGVFGFIMGSGPLYWWFVEYLPKRFLGLPKWQAVIARFESKIVADFLKHAITCLYRIRSVTDAWTLMPFFYFPIFYQVKEAIFWDGKTPLSESSLVSDSLVLAVLLNIGFVPDIISSTQVCVPINIVLFSSVPSHFRVPALSLFGFIWILTLSSRRGAHENEKDLESSQ